MAFLTEYSFRQLIEMSEIKDLDRIDLQFFTTNIYDNQYLYYFFNQFDLKKLYREKVILSGDKSFLPTYREVPDRIDNLHYVLEIKGKVKYHYDIECTALKSGFKNFFMPEPVVKLELVDKDKHQLLVQHVRNWFKINNYTVDRYEKGEINDRLLTNSFNRDFPEKFNIEPIFISQSERKENQFQWYISKSSDNVQLKRSFSYDEFLINIIKLIKERDYLCNSKTLKNLSKYDYLLHKTDEEINEVLAERINNGGLKEVDPVFITTYTLSRLKEFWKLHRNVKQRAYKEISEYLKWTYNFKEKHFDEIFLEDFNLVGCSLCKVEKIIP